MTKPYGCARKGLLLGDLQHCTSGSIFHKMMESAKVSLTTDPADDYFFAIKWAPWSLFEIPASIRAGTKTRTIINDTHFRCGKSNVMKCFEAVFNYPLEVNPLSWSGPCVVKSEKNACHDGRVVECPISQRGRDVVYQILVDTVVEGNLTEHVRVPIFNGLIPFVYLKHRPVETRFAPECLRVRLAGKHELFAREEIRLIGQFARHIGLDYGELDVLRDQNTGRIYIVDANNTPYGPAEEFSPIESEITIRLLTDTFFEHFIA